MVKKTTEKVETKSKEKSSKILYRSETNKVLGGICGGLGEVFNIDPTIIRVLFVLTMIFGGSSLFFYVVLWAVIPTRSKIANTSNENIRENIDEMKDRVHTFTKDFRYNKGQRPNAGLILLVIGVIFLLGNFGYIHIYNLSRLWPLFLIAFGFLLLSRNNRH